MRNFFGTSILLRTCLLSLVLAGGSILHAERSKSSTSIAIGEPVDPVVECRTILSSYKEYIRDPFAQLDDSVIQSINAVFVKDITCTSKVTEVEAILSAYWATEPWCRRDREKFVTLYTQAIADQLTTEAKTIVAALLNQGSLTCYETLGAATTVVRLYVPTFVLYEDSATLENSGAAVSSMISTETFDVKDFVKTKKQQKKA